MSPAIPTLRELQHHIEQEIGSVSRGARHSVPEKDLDVARLADQYTKSKLHTYKEGRQIKGREKNQAIDYIMKGSLDLEAHGTINSWWQNHSYKCLTTEVWDE